MGLCGNLSVITTFGGGGTQLQVIMPDWQIFFKVRLTFAKVSMDKPINFFNIDTICYAMKCHSKICGYDFQ